MRILFPPTLITFLSFSVVSPAMAEGWLQPKGETLAIFDASHFTTNDFYNQNGTKQHINGRFSKVAGQVYVEHGLRDWVTILAIGEMSRSQQRSALNLRTFDVKSVSGDIGARFPITSFDGGVLASRVMVSLPDKHTGNNANSNFRENMDAEMGLEAGYSFPLWGRNHYVSGSAAYRKRSGSASNQWLLHAVAGFKLNDNIEIMPELEYQGKAGGRLNNSLLPAVAGQNDFKQVKATLAALWHMNDSYSLQLGATAPLYTRSTGAGYTTKVALWHRF